jgi:HSP20 family protein
MSERDDPFADIERLVDQFTQFGTASEIPVDVVDAGEAFVVVADLPGHEADEIDVELHDDDRLRIAAAGRETDAEGTAVRRERRQEAVERTVRLPGPVDEAATSAGYEAGVLTVRLGKRAAETGGTDIPVR